MSNRNTLLEDKITHKMPTFLSKNFDVLLNEKKPESRLKQLLHLYNLELRLITITFISQYLIIDKDLFSDNYLNDILFNDFPHITMSDWRRLLFTAFKAYKGRKKLLYIPELYDTYWGTKRPKVEIQHLFNRLTQISTEYMGIKEYEPDACDDIYETINEVEDLLFIIFDTFIFFEKYDLIYILSIDNEYYKFELHKGLSIDVQREILPTNTTLQRGWFYFRSQRKKFLPLHNYFKNETGIHQKYINEFLKD